MEDNKDLILGTTTSGSMLDSAGFLLFLLLHVADMLLFTGQSLHSRLVLATAEQKRQQEIFDDFTQSLRAQPGLGKEWTDMVLAWERDPTQKNPYVSLVSCTPV